MYPSPPYVSVRVCVSAERNEWVSALQEATGEWRRSRELVAHPGACTAEMQGYLELRGLRSKLFVVVSGDKVYLYKNTEVSRHPLPGRSSSPPLQTLSQTASSIKVGFCK